MDSTAIATTYRMRVARFSPRIRVKLPGGLAITATGAVIKKRFEGNDADERQPRIEDAYQIDRLPGFVQGTTHLYDELEVAWDTRHTGWAYDPPGMDSAGGLVMAFIARQDGIDDGPAFYRAGVDLQRYVALDHGPRVIQLRFSGELVTGKRDQVPFSELPRLGGKSLLRGYATDRFRDRVATVAEAGYLWSLGWDTAATLFVDAGRVHPSVRRMSVDDLRVGYGAAIEAYGRRGMLLRAEIASSIEGGFMGYVSVEPVFDARSRVERN
jgi:surface antigen Omp85-like protein